MSGLEEKSLPRIFPPFEMDSVAHMVMPTLLDGLVSTVLGQRSAGAFLLRWGTSDADTSNRRAVRQSTCLSTFHHRSTVIATLLLSLKSMWQVRVSVMSGRAGVVSHYVLAATVNGVVTLNGSV